MENAYDFQFTGCWFGDAKGGSGANISKTIYTRFLNCTFLGNSAPGLTLKPGTKFTNVNGCLLATNCAGANEGATFSAGCFVEAGVTDFTIMGCSATNDTAAGRETPNATTQKWGIKVAKGASERYTIANNLVSGNKEAVGVLDEGEKTEEERKAFVKNNF